MLFLLLFADDMVMMSETPDGLQTCLDNLKRYCDVWGLCVNIDKTKVVVFRKSCFPILHNFVYDNVNLEILNQFNYIGFVMVSNGKHNRAIANLADRGLKACNVLLMEIRRLKLDIKSSLELFDSCVMTVLNYGCEIWGYMQEESIEKVHRKLSQRSNSMDHPIS